MASAVDFDYTFMTQEDTVRVLFNLSQYIYICCFIFYLNVEELLIKLQLWRKSKYCFCYAKQYDLTIL